MVLDSPRIVLLPGLDGTGILFRGLTKALDTSPPPVIVRYPTGCHSLDAHADQALQQLPSQGRLILVAESFSGPVAINLAPRIADRLDAILFFTTFATSPDLKLTLLNAAILRRLLSLPMPDFVARLLLLGPGAPQSLCDDLRIAIRQAGVETLAHRLKLLAHLDLTDDMGSISAPCCYVRATGDRLVPARAVAPFKHKIEHITMQTVDGPHFILQARPIECALIISDIMGRKRHG